MSQTKQVNMTNMQNKESAESVIDLIYAFVCRVAKELYLLIGIETPFEVLLPIAKNLFTTNPNILKNEEIILKTLAFNDFQFRNPKQLIPDDFVITPQKMKRLQDAGEVWYSQTRLDEILSEFTTTRIESLQSKIADLYEEIRMLELRWMKEPETETKLGWKPFIERMNQLEDENIKISQKCTEQEIFIVKLEARNERLKNNLQVMRNIHGNIPESESQISEEKSPEDENNSEMIENNAIK